MSAIKPPFTLLTAQQKVKAAQANWNTRNPAKICLAYTPNSVWRNRNLFIRGRQEIVSFLEAKWRRELHYRLRKELFAFEGNRIAVQFWYEYMDGDEFRASGRERWWRCYGIEHWRFDAEGIMERRMMSGNDVELGVGGPGGERWFKGEVGEEGVDALVDGIGEIPEGHF